MARPSKRKRIQKLPKYQYFYGENDQLEIILTIEEYEVIRLIDYLGLSQSECANEMLISRSSVVSLYNNARKKLARFLIEGSLLQINGGHYFLKNQEGKRKMKIAVTCVDGQVFQHFGHCPQFLVCHVENNQIISTEMLNTSNYGCHLLADYLYDHGIDVVICGGIGGGAKNHIQVKGIQLLPGASGDAYSQVESYIAGTLNYDPESECQHHKDDEHHQCGHHHKC